MHVTWHVSIDAKMRGKLTSDGLKSLMKELARSSADSQSSRVFIVGGGTAVLAGWRASTIDADLHSDSEEAFRDIQAIKERLQLNVEFVRPEQFVPELAGSETRHVFIESIGSVSFFHYDPSAQLLSKIVRGFNRDLEDARNFLASGMVDGERFRSLVYQIPEAAYSLYPALSRAAVMGAVDGFLDEEDNQS